MTTERVGSIPYVPKGECRHCRGPLPKRRRTFCSARCVTDALIHKGDPVTVRREVHARDKGVCVECGLDTDLIQRIVRTLYRRGDVETRTSGEDAAIWLVRLVTGRPKARHLSHLWEADHVVPVVEGGGGCGLEGYRTLCLKCHGLATAALAARRAEQRRQQKADARIAAWTGKAVGA